MPLFIIGDLVDTASSDKSMGPAQIIAFHRDYAIVWYVNYPDCYRPIYMENVVPWEPRAEGPKRL